MNQRDATALASFWTVHPSGTWFAVGTFTYIIIGFLAIRSGRNAWRQRKAEQNKIVHPPQLLIKNDRLDLSDEETSQLLMEYLISMGINVSKASPHFHQDELGRMHRCWCFCQDHDFLFTWKYVLAFSIGFWVEHIWVHKFPGAYELARWLNIA